MKTFRNRPGARFRAALWLVLLLFSAACAHQAPPKPPDPGQVITRRAHSVYYYDFNYSLGRTADRLRVVGKIGNAITADLNRFIVSLTVRDPEGRTVARGSSDYFDVENMEDVTFAIDLPLLHGPCSFIFRCDYLHLDELDEGRGGGLNQARDLDIFTDKIDLP